MALSNRLFWNILGTATAGPQALEGTVDPRGVVTADRGSLYCWNTASVRAWFVNDSAGATGTAWRLLGSALEFAQTAPATPITVAGSGIAEAIFDESATIPADVLAAGSAVRVWGSGQVVTGGAASLTLRVRIGGLAGALILALPAASVATNDEFVFSAQLTVRTAGAAGTFVASGMGMAGAPGAMPVVAQAAQSAAIDTTVASVVGVTAQWSALGGLESARLDQLNVAIG